MAQSDLDWNDIFLHAAIGAGIGAVSAVTIGWPLVVANAAFWIGREAWQRWQKKQPFHHMLSTQVLLEWAVPSVLGLAAYLICKALVG